MSLEFTDQQKKAIDTLDKSILVSAAAGSGKTAVLVQRIIKIILEGKANVDEMLVVTFTKAAASEMRTKVAKAIKKEIKEKPEKRKELKNQLDRLYKSYISTIDSFAVRIIKEFFYLVDVEPNFNACDDVQSTIMQRDAIDELFEEAFENDNLIEGCSFREFLRLYSQERSDETLKTNIIAAYQKLRTMPDYWDWAKENAKQLSLGKEEFFNSKLGREIWQDAYNVLSNAVTAIFKIKDLFESVNLKEAFEEKLGAECNSILSTYHRLNTGSFDDELFDEMIALPDSFVRLDIRKQGQKEQYDLIREDVKAIRTASNDDIKAWVSKYCLPNLDARIKEMNDSYKYTLYYINLMEKFEEKYKALKAKDKLLDFSDMEHTAVEILKNDQASEAMKKRFKYIFIDEYQDTNNIQENLIARVSKANNVFKVGDVKQSIYRFRQAEPAIFQGVYQDYSCESNTDAIAIDLNQNFRCNGNTINYINKVFEDIMDGYDDKAKLYKGVEDFDEKYDFIPEFHLLYSEWDEEETESGETNNDAEITIENISKEEAEARYIAGLVKNHIGTDFYDTAKKKIRKVEARDIVILLRSTKGRGDIFARALRDVGVQSHIEEADNYYDTVEVGLALSMFRCIDNIKRDVPLIATLHSDVFSWSPEELAKVRASYNEIGERRAPYWEALLWYAENGNDAAIKEKANSSINQIKKWRSTVNMMPLADYIWDVLIDSGLYIKIGAMFDGERRQANLKTLVDRARHFSENGVASLSSFLGYIEVMKSKEIKSGQVSMVSKDDDVVRVMTIHKSKGLEYPFVIVGGLGHKFMNDNNTMDLSFDSELGISLAYISSDRKYWRSTLMQRAINTKTKRLEFEEQLRVLYVAMTRARNKLILVGTTTSAEKLMQYSTSSQHYLKVLREELKTPYNNYFESVLDTSAEKNQLLNTNKLIEQAKKKTASTDIKYYDAIDNRLSYDYPYKSQLTDKAKYSVSDLRRQDAEKPGIEVSKNRDAKIDYAKLGTAYHKIMETLDFGSISQEQIIGCARKLHDSGAIEDAIFKAIDLNRIAQFFISDLGKRAVFAARNGKLKKEKEFTLSTKWQDKDILVQGIIDCCWEEDGKMVLLDYKTNFVNPNKPHEAEMERIKSEYKAQLDLYQSAIYEGTGKEVKEAYLYLFATGEAVAC